MAFCCIAAMVCGGGLRAQQTVYELPVQDQVLPTDGVPVFVGERKALNAEGRVGDARLKAELLIPKYSDFPDPADFGGSTVKEDEESTAEGDDSEARPLGGSAESLAFGMGGAEEPGTKRRMDLGGIEVLGPGEETWALCFATSARVVSGRSASRRGDGDPFSAQDGSVAFWQGGLNLGDLGGGLRNDISMDSGMAWHRMLGAAPVRASATCVLIAVVGFGWLARRFWRRDPGAFVVEQGPGEEW